MGIPLALHQADLFQRNQGAGHRGGGEPQCSGQIHSAKLPAGRPAELEEHGEVAEADAMQGSQAAVEPADQPGVGPGQTQAEVE